MTRHKDFKRIVRDRMRRAGERYTTARERLSSSRTPAVEPLERRILGMKTKYSIVPTGGLEDRIGMQEAARYLFRRVTTDGRPMRTFLDNGAYVGFDDAGALEYATPECDSAHDAVVWDKAGEPILRGLARSANQRLREQGVPGELALRKSTGRPCHESYLIRRPAPFERYIHIVPFLVTRQVFAGTGAVVDSVDRVSFCLSPCAISGGASRGGRPIVDTHVSPHADPERFARLHLTVGDANASEASSFLKLATTLLVLAALESDAPVPDVRLQDPVRALRDVSADPTCLATVDLSDGRTLTALEVQNVYAEHVRRTLHPQSLPAELVRALDAWERVLAALARDPLSTSGEVEWSMKYRALDAYARRNDAGLDDPRVRSLADHYADLDPTGQSDRRPSGGAREHDEIESATANAPTSTRAALRSTFVRHARASGRDHSVDWVHLKLNDAANRTVLCTDPLANTDPRVERLIASM